MNFKELFERYKSKTATDEEIEIVKQEIEKVRLIYEYLEEEDDLKIDLEPNDEEVNPYELKSIQNKITKNRRKLITTSVAWMVLIIIVFQIWVVPLINNWFYNPTITKYEDSYREDIALQLDVYSDLHFPDHYVSGVIVENTGIGKYSFTVILGNKFTSEEDYFYGNINKGRMEFDFNITRKHLPLNIFDMHNLYPDSYIDLLPETISKIKELPSYINVNAYISFERDLSMEEFAEIYKEFYEEDLFINWVGIREIDAGHRGHLIGFSPPGVEPWFEELKSTYPYLNISMDINENIENLNHEVFEKHFKELLQFQLDNISFLNMLQREYRVGEYTYYRYYKEILEYVNENGVNTYGMKVQGSPENILKLIEHEAFANIIVDELKLSMH